MKRDSLLRTTIFTLLIAMLMILIGGARKAMAQAPQTAANLPTRKTTEVAETKTMRVLALRLRPGQDLRQQLEAFAKQHRLRAGFIITTVGSLHHAAIRLADQPEATKFEGKFEIVSLVGTLGPDGVHLHISIADSSGKTIGGHLVEGCVIYTTAEIVIGDATGLVFSREKDEQTGYQELRIRHARRPRNR